MRTACAKIWSRANTPLIVVASRAVNAACGLVTAPVLARSLGPEGRGYSAAILAILTVAPIVLALGVPLAVRRRASVGESQSGLIRVGILFSLSILPIAALLALGLTASLFAELSVDAKIWLGIAVLTAPLTVLSNVLASILVVRGQYSRLAAVYCIQLVVFACVILVLWLAGRVTLASVPIAYSAGSLATLIVALLWVHPTDRGQARLAAIAREGCSLVGGQIADIASQRLDQILIVPLVGAATGGIYSVAVTLGSVPMALAFGLNAASFPEISRETAVGSPAVGRTIRYSAALSLLTCASLALACPWLVPAVFGTDFVSAVPAALVGLLGSFALVVGYTASMCLIAMHRGSRATLAQISGLAVGTCLLWPLATTYGPTGAAIASATGYFVTLAFTLVFLGRMGALVNAKPMRADLLSACRYMVTAVR